MEDSLRVPGADPGSTHNQNYSNPPVARQQEFQGGYGGQSRVADSLSLRSAEKRIGLLHDVVSIRSGSSRRPHSVHLPPKKTVWQRFKDGFRSFIAFVFSNVGICVLVLGYLILGAFMFQHLEMPEQVKESRIVSRRRQTVAALWNITEHYNTLHPTNWSIEVINLISSYELEVIEAIKDNSFDGQDIPVNLWTFSGALLYSITVITTIGYGHMVPVTPVGKMVTILYAIIGVPLFLLYLSNIGEIFATSFKWSYSRLCKCQILRSHRLRRQQFRVDALPHTLHGPGGLIELQSAVSEREKTSMRSDRTMSDNSLEDGSSLCTNEEEEDDDEYSDVNDNKPEALHRVSVPISLSLTVMILYICGGAILFGEWEGWGFLDGSYFCFITLSTIGFGDMVPGDAVSEDDDEATVMGGLVNLQFIFCSLYIIFGMAVIAMCFSLMQEKVVRGVLAMGRKIGIIKNEAGG